MLCITKTRYVFDGRLEEACLFLSRLLDVQEVGDRVALTKLVSVVGMRTGPPVSPVLAGGCARRGLRGFSLAHS